MDDIDGFIASVGQVVVIEARVSASNQLMSNDTSGVPAGFPGIGTALFSV